LLIPCARRVGSGIQASTRQTIELFICTPRKIGMATTTKPLKKRLTKAEREAQAEARRKLVDSLWGKYAWVKGSSNDIRQERRQEVEEEEKAFQQYLKARPKKKSS
jgi:hypothetical protein